MQDWKNRISRLRIGGKVELKSIEGFWVKPRKFSVEENDLIQAANIAALSKVKRSAFAQATQKIRSRAKDDPDALVVDLLDERELEALMDAQFAPAARIVHLQILYGVAEHNFCEQESTTHMDETLADEIMQVPEIAGEIALIAQGYNGPLVQGNSPISGTSPHGSTREPSST